MDYNELLEELSPFGVTFADENVFNALNFYVKKYSLEDAIVDELIAYVANNKVTLITEAVVTELFEKHLITSERRNENVPPLIESKPKIVPIKKEEIFNDDIKVEDTSKSFSISAKMEDKITVKLCEDENSSGFRLVSNPLYCDNGYDDEFETITTEAGDEVEIQGRILVVPAGPNREEGVRLLSRRHGNFTLKLDNLANEYIFDRMEVTMYGTTDGQHVFIPQNLVKPEATPNAEVACMNLKLLNSLPLIMVACGPFNDSSGFYLNRLQRIFKHALSHGVKLLILFGPVLNISSLVNDSQFHDLQAIFNHFLVNVNQLAAASMDVVVVPSVENDSFVITPQYPTNAYESSYTFDRIHLVKNPSVFNYDGLQIALANFDTMLALGKGNLLTTALPANDRMKWNVEQMLQYGHICPSFSRPGTMIKNTFYKLPTLFISPSKLRPLAFNAHNVLFVNLRNFNGNGICTIQPKCLETNGENIQMSFETVFLAP